MFKKSMFCVALASLVLATSCSQDDLQTAKFSQNTINPNVELGGQPISTFAAAKGKAVKSRAVETTITNLGSFTMNAFQDGEANYMKDMKYTSTDGSVWNTDAGTFYWPVEGNLRPSLAYLHGQPTLEQRHQIYARRGIEERSDRNPSAYLSSQCLEEESSLSLLL
jgi:hypothetical protein